MCVRVSLYSDRNVQLPIGVCLARLLVSCVKYRVARGRARLSKGSRLVCQTR